MLISVLAGLAFRRRFRGSGVVFYLAIASLIMPGLFVGLGIALSFRLLGLPTSWYTSALGAQLTWTLPFGLLIMFAVLGRFNRSYEEAANDLGATQLADAQRGRRCRSCCRASSAWRCSASPCPTTSSPRTALAVGAKNTLPLEIWAMTTNVTSPALYRGRHGDDRRLVHRDRRRARLDRRSSSAGAVATDAATIE